jgi:outer membrane protein OmpA-like peptidoglycan-associated protein
MRGRGARYIGVAVAAALLAGCSGGGGQGEPAPAPPPNQGQGGDQAQIDAAEREDIEGKLVQLLQQRPITFDADGARLTSQGRQTVVEISQVITESPSVLRFAVGGYTAPGPGSPGGAQQLSQQRAQTVVDDMVRQGVAANRLQARAYGDAPRSDPDTSRTVDIKIL